MVTLDSVQRRSLVSDVNVLQPSTDSWSLTVDPILVETIQHPKAAQINSFIFTMDQMTTCKIKGVACSDEPTEETDLPR